jgi:hypothetical protein
MARPDVNWGTITTQYLQPTVQNIQFSPLVDMIELLSVQAKSQIARIRSEKSSMSIADMFDLQMAMNKLSQFSDMSTSIISALNSSIGSVNRNIGK